MIGVTGKTEKVKNVECPFTELFSILKQYKTLSQGLLGLGYETEDLKVMHLHIDNAMYVLLQGLQDMGRLISIVAEDRNRIIEKLNNIGFFIAAITNLTEALNILKSDTDYMLRQRNVLDY